MILPIYDLVGFNDDYMDPIFDLIDRGSCNCIDLFILIDVINVFINESLLKLV